MTTACLMCGEDAAALLADLEATKTQVRRLRMENRRLRGKAKAFAEETNRIITELHTHKEN